MHINRCLNTRVVKKTKIKFENIVNEKKIDWKTKNV